MDVWGEVCVFLFREKVYYFYLMFFKRGEFLGQRVFFFLKWMLGVVRVYSLFFGFFVVCVICSRYQVRIGIVQSIWIRSCRSRSVLLIFFTFWFSRYFSVVSRWQVRLQMSVFKVGFYSLFFGVRILGWFVRELAENQVLGLGVGSQWCVFFFREYCRVSWWKMRGVGEVLRESERRSVRGKGFGRGCFQFIFKFGSGVVVQFFLGL